MEPRAWLIIIVLAVAAAGTQWLLWLARDRPDAETFAGPPRSDYTLTDFTLNALDTDGRRTFQISGPRLARRGDDGSIFVTTPRYLLTDGSGRPWQGTSDSAWVDKEGSLMKLQGQVEMRRAAGADAGPIEVVTRDLTTWPKTGKMETAAAATITQPGSILRGVGMRGDLNTKVLELLSDVHTTLQPARAAKK